MDNIEHFTNKAYRIIIYIYIYIYYNLSQIPCKIFATQCFFTDPLKPKIVNKITCRVPFANPRQLCTD